MTFEPMFVWSHFCLCLCFFLCVQFYGRGCVYVCVHVPGPYKQRLENGYSLIRLQKWVCSLSPLSPACLPLPLSLSNSFCLSQSLPLSCLYVCASLSLSGYRGLKLASPRLLPLAPLQTTSSLPVCISPSFFPFPDRIVHTPCRRL